MPKVINHLTILSLKKGNGGQGVWGNIGGVVRRMCGWGHTCLILYFLFEEGCLHLRLIRAGQLNNKVLYTGRFYHIQNDKGGLTFVLEALRSILFYKNFFLINYGIKLI